MADQLQLDVIVDDHGGVQKLADVDAGVKKVTATAQQATPSLDDLNRGFAEARERLDRLSTSAPTAGLGLNRLTVMAGATGAALTIVAMGLRQAAEESDRLTQSAEQLAAPASRIQQITTAAAESKVGFDQMAGALTNLQERLGSGRINEHLSLLGINLDEIRKQDVVEQFLRISDAVGRIADPADRAAMRVRLLGTDSKEMARLMTEAFREATDGAVKMSDETIKRFDAIYDGFSHTASRIMATGKAALAESAMYFLDPLGRDNLKQLVGKLPDVAGPNRSLPEGLPSLQDGRPDGRAALVATTDALRAQLELSQELSASWAMTIEMVHLYGTDAPAAITIVDERLKQIAEAQSIITKGAGDWSDVLDTRVSASVDAITGKLFKAIELNALLAGGATQDRDRLMAQLTGTTNPNESEFDRKFNAIDQRFKDDMAKVDQTDRETAAIAENAILERTNLEVLQLQQNWEAATAKVTDHQKEIAKLGTAYDTAFQPKGGTALPGGLVAPTAEQVATGRYYGPVTPSGEPDLARMGGAAPITHNWTVDARGALLDTPGGLDDLVRKLETAMAQRATAQGAQVSRR